MTDILMPALSPTMEEGTLAKWLVKAGDRVAAGDVIAEIETDKATMEVEAVDEGVIEVILVSEGSEGVKVNTPIARLAGQDAAVSEPSPEPVPEAQQPADDTPAPATAPEPAVASPAVRRILAEASLDADDIVGTGRGGRVTKGDALAAAARADEARISASPLARRLAEQLEIDLSTLTGSGSQGRIVTADIVSKRPGEAPAAAPAGSAPAAAPREHASLEQQGVLAGSYELIPLDGMRKTVARRMTESFRDVPHFPLGIDIEIDELLAARARINAMLERQGVKVSVNDMVIKASAAALMRVPAANASYTPDGIAMHRHADIAMAVAVPGGLITPIIRAAETKGLAQIAVEAKDLAERARNKKLKPEEFQGGTFSVSNLGMFGIRSFASIINEPQGAILSVGAGERRPVVRGDKLEIATVMSVTLTCDHRVVDGAVGAAWLDAFRNLIADPLAMIV